MTLHWCTNETPKTPKQLRYRFKLSGGFEVYTQYVAQLLLQN